MPPQMIEPSPTAEQLLRFYIDAGVDAVLSETPIDRLAPIAEPEPVVAAAAVAAASAGSAIGASRSIGVSDSTASTPAST